MATTHEITVERREDEGKGASRRLRRAGKIPAIVYGGGLDPVSIQLAHEPVWLASQHDWFYSSILGLNLGGNIQRVLLRDIQRHPYKQLILHLDFQRVDEKELLRTSVPLSFVNVENSPAGKAADVLVTQELKEVAVECLPSDLPQVIEVDLSELKVGDIIYLSELKLPSGVEIPQLKLGKDHDDAVVIAKLGRVGVAEEEAAGEEADASDAEDKDK